MNFADVADDAASTVEMAANAVAVVAGARRVPVIFDRAGVTSVGFVESTGPVAVAAASEVPDLARADAFDIGAERFRVKGLQPDGHGLITIALEIAA